MSIALFRFPVHMLALSLMLFALLSFGLAPGSGQAAAAQKEPFITVDSLKLWQDFVADKDAAAKRYGNWSLVRKERETPEKYIFVTGEVVDTTSNPHYSLIILRGGWDNGKGVTIDIESLYGIDAHESVAGVSMGDHVLIRGYIYIYREHETHKRVTLGDGIIVPQRANAEELMQAFTQNAEQAAILYGDRYLPVTGKVVEVNLKKDGWSEDRILLRGGFGDKAGAVFCVFADDAAARAAQEVKPGDVLTFNGIIYQYGADGVFMSGSIQK